ncbi:putative translation initiation factor IF2/IF5, initiation factor eIF-4 gamma, MA3 [Helianthus annuus]|uniref:Translation initiation factor IF2/IF5, initiation factor eIF-4 gamma, MA3 n=2 Tax=Helianthus annuus TaxID=4232 RepID=A0A9K3MYF2_HELAN|nr:eukaryotic translation initiation factor 5 isoform X3 [Helianthus annuus]KAF5780382.1 putative translation initiation factor IF2/IF5, initiation factor eIF-4 gamma, MA3 [Helianthus annuus]
MTPITIVARKVASIVDDYFTNDDVDLAASKLKELGPSEYNPYLIKRLVSMTMDRHDMEKEKLFIRMSSVLHKSSKNIGASNSDDAFYRYKMPKMITKIEGRGNGIKTNIVNMVDVAKSLARPASYTTKYFGCELGAQSKFDEKTGVSLVNGSHDTAKLAGLLENFIKKYVPCYCCGNPKREILITKTQMVQLKCVACGFVSDVDMRDKLTSFILKNPPEQKKNSKDKKVMTRAEEERLKEGEAADKIKKKLIKDVKKTKDKTSTKKKGNASDEDHTSPTLSHTGDKDDGSGEEDDDCFARHRRCCSATGLTSY